MAQTDQAALLAAIDAGQDECLHLLADLLEETGDRRAAGLRRALALGRCAAGLSGFTPGVAAWGWGLAKASGSQWAHWLPEDVFARLQGGELDSSRWGVTRFYPARSQAYLALAEALG